MAFSHHRGKGPIQLMLVVSVTFMASVISCEVNCFVITSHYFEFYGQNYVIIRTTVSVIIKFTCAITMPFMYGCIHPSVSVELRGSKLMDFTCDMPLFLNFRKDVFVLINRFFQ